MTGMPARKPPSAATPQWLQVPRLKLPLGDAQAALASLITTGRRLGTEAPEATDAEVFTRRVHEWRRNTSQWLDENIGGQVADEYRNVIESAMSHTWSSYYWNHYYADRREDIESETRTLESIAQRLPSWVQSSDETAPASSSVKAKQRPARITRRPKKEAGQQPDRNDVMVIYGHDQEANTALFEWLRAIGLRPKEWSQLIQLSGSASPYTGQVLEHAFRNVQAVVALFTPDEHVRAADTRSAAGGAWRLQARPNVLIEAGMALVTHPDRTVLICLGPQEIPSDLAGRHYVRLNGTAKALSDIATCLETAGCVIDRSGGDWLDPTIFPDRDGVPTSPQQI